MNDLLKLLILFSIFFGGAWLLAAALWLVGYAAGDGPSPP